MATDRELRCLWRIDTEIRVNGDALPESSRDGIDSRPICILAVWSVRHVARVPAVYLGSAFLPFLAFLAERRMNNLQGFNRWRESKIPPLRQPYNPLICLPLFS
jgi:hypothetical protein